MYRVLYLIILTFIISSCSNSSKDCFKSAGEVDSVIFDFGEFSRIDVYDIFNVYIEQNPEYSVKVRTNSSLLNNVSVQLTDSALVIEDNNKCYFLRDYALFIDIIISAPDLSQINFYNASTAISLNQLNYERFLFRAYGKLAFCDLDVNCSDHFFLSLWNVSGDYNVKGKCTFFDILNHGTAFVNAFDLKATYVSVKQRSTGDIKLWAKNKLNAEIFDIGNIYYKGSPTIDSSSYNSGKLIKAD